MKDCRGHLKTTSHQMLTPSEICVSNEGNDDCPTIEIKHKS